MDSSELKKLKRIANGLKPQFNLGKSGVTSTFIESVESYLEAHKIVKVKVLSAVDKSQVSDIADKLAEEIDSVIVEKKGFTFVVYRD